MSTQAHSHGRGGAALDISRSFWVSDWYELRTFSWCRLSDRMKDSVSRTTKYSHFSDVRRLLQSVFLNGRLWTRFHRHRSARQRRLINSLMANGTMLASCNSMSVRLCSGWQWSFPAAADLMSSVMFYFCGCSSILWGPRGSLASDFCGLRSAVGERLRKLSQDRQWFSTLLRIGELPPWERKKSHALK